MPTTHKQCDLFNTQPFKIYGPIEKYAGRRRREKDDFPASIDEAIKADLWRAVAGVTYEGKDCFTWWNADYLISARMPGSMGGGSGFANYPYKDTILEFDAKRNMWFFKNGPFTDNFGKIYETFFYFALLEPDRYAKDRDALRAWEAYRQYCPTLEELREKALGIYSGNPESEKIRADFIRENAEFIKAHPYYLADKVDAIQESY